MYFISLMCAPTHPPSVPVSHEIGFAGIRLLLAIAGLAAFHWAHQSEHKTQCYSPPPGLSEPRPCREEYLDHSKLGSRSLQTRWPISLIESHSKTHEPLTWLPFANMELVFAEQIEQLQIRKITLLGRDAQIHQHWQKKLLSPGQEFEQSMEPSGLFAGWSPGAPYLAS